MSRKIEENSLQVSFFIFNLGSLALGTKLSASHADFMRLFQEHKLILHIRNARILSKRLTRPSALNYCVDSMKFEPRRNGVLVHCHALG